jgi:hypothetical protein
MIVVLFMPGGVIGLTRRIEEAGGIRFPWTRQRTDEKKAVEASNVS